MYTDGVPLPSAVTHKWILKRIKIKNPICRHSVPGVHYIPHSYIPVELLWTRVLPPLSVKRPYKKCIRYSQCTAVYTMGWEGVAANHLIGCVWSVLYIYTYYIMGINVVIVVNLKAIIWRCKWGVCFVFFPPSIIRVDKKVR